MDVLVTYDIDTHTRAGEIRLARVAKVCERFGTRVQYSVFECRLSDVAFQKLIVEIEGIIEAAIDSVHFYRFAGVIRESRLVVGRPKPRELGDPWIV